jgi:Ran GTPase-activating protein (RanGAP) involved in mRNA processing and transport
VKNNFVGVNDMDVAASSISLSLSSALLHHSTTLKTLNLSCVEGLTIAGWNSIMQCVGGCALLENLDLSTNYFTNENIAAIANALVNNRSLREINLSLISGVSEAGWTAFSAVLRNPESVLEVIDLSCNSVNDEVVQSFSDALVNNTKLKEFNVRMTSITSNGFAAFTHLLCNSTSIVTTYQSNHTIEELWKKDDDEYDDDDEDDESNTLPEDLINLLRLNKENSPNEAARLKIINTHFSGHEINMQRPWASGHMPSLGWDGITICIDSCVPCHLCLKQLEERSRLRKGRGRRSDR